MESKPTETQGEDIVGEPGILELGEVETRTLPKTLGKLMFDPAVSNGTLESLVDAFDGRLHILIPVDGYLEPVLQTKTERFIGQEAILAYLKSL
jgi:hypothetical protein